MRKAIDLIVKNINELFKQSGMTQQEFGVAVGLQQATVSRLLKGEFENLQLETIENIAKAFNKPASWLMLDHTQEHPSNIDEMLRTILKRTEKLETLPRDSLIKDSPISTGNDDRDWLLTFVLNAQDVDVKVIRTIVETQMKIRQKSKNRSGSGTG